MEGTLYFDIKYFCNFVLLVKEGKCARATGRVNGSQKSTQKGTVPTKHRDLTAHKVDVETDKLTCVTEVLMLVTGNTCAE